MTLPNIRHTEEGGRCEWSGCLFGWVERTECVYSTNACFGGCVGNEKWPMYVYHANIFGSVCVFVLHLLRRRRLLRVD